MKKNIVLCADDYGQAKAISEGIIALLQQQRLSAVSCLVTGSGWPKAAQALLPYRQQADIGLHFNLTEPGPYGLPQLMLRSQLRCLSQATIEQALQAQIDAFEAAMGVLPDFIDGHQHIHQFPVIRDALMQVYEQRFKNHRLYIRLVNVRRNTLKKAIIYGMGTPALHRLLVARGIPHNQSFSGIYAFNKAERYGDYFSRFLAEVTNNGLIMCHPGLVDANDPISRARQMEYAYLSGEGLVDSLAAEGAVLGRFPRVG